MRAKMCVIWAVLTACLIIAVLSSYAYAGAENAEKHYCLKCHGVKGQVKKFSDGDFIETYLDRKAYDASAHKSLRCTACHKEFSDQLHPNRTFKNKLQYRIRESRGCRECHTDKALKSRSVHETLFKKEKTGEGIVCTNCHSAHSVAPITAGNVSTSEERYCLNCHAHEKKMVFNNGESLSVRVHIAELRESPHKNVGCSDCHFAFSADDHPRRQFRSERDYRISSSEMCRRCHFDKYTKVAESIHFNKLSAGRLEAPRCVDCHGGHTARSLGKSRLSVVGKCRSCHAKVYDEYARSVHGSALSNESNRDVPICIDCHSSHTIKAPLSSDFHNAIPDMCGNCHSNATLMGKYGLSTEVIKTYLSDFHGMTLSLYRKEAQKRYRPSPAMAVCTDCHGTHSITRLSNADMGVVKKNLLNRCRTCHPDATENFPDAWLSHYKPSLKVAPAVFITEQFFKIIMPIMIVGFLCHIFLHLWRYLANR